MNRWVYFIELWRVQVEWEINNTENYRQFNKYWNSHLLYFLNSVVFDCYIWFFSRIFLFLHFLHVLNVLRKFIMREEGVPIVDYLDNFQVTLCYLQTSNNFGQIKHQQFFSTSREKTNLKLKIVKISRHNTPSKSNSEYFCTDVKLLWNA